MNIKNLSRAINDFHGAYIEVVEPEKTLTISLLEQTNKVKIWFIDRKSELEKPYLHGHGRWFQVYIPYSNLVVLFKFQAKLICIRKCKQSQLPAYLKDQESYLKAKEQVYKEAKNYKLK